jgi:fumarate hydratase class II
MAEHNGEFGPTATEIEYRIEHDTMGEVRVPRDAKYQAQTQRAVENFPISFRTLEQSQIRALALIKSAAAAVNARLGVIPQDIAEAISKSADRIADGEFLADFPLDVFQTGSGTSSNMNANEVIATLAAESLGAKVHPNDHVNASQSSNDVFPTSIHVAATESVARNLLPALAHLEAALEAKSVEWATVVKSGRTHLMDATPVTLGQEFGGYASQVGDAADRIEAALPEVGRLPLGGTAVGTGINAPKRFAPRVIAALNADLGLGLSEAPDHFAAQGARDALVGVSGDLRRTAVALVKIANDIRWMGSGPRTGLAEIRLPDLQPGSSIMPGKVNPVMAEAVTQVAAQVMGNDAAIAFGGSQGNFELNVYLPLIADRLLESIRLLSRVSTLFAERCVHGIEADEERCRNYAESSPAIVTALNPIIGYERASKVVKESLRSGRTLREVLIEDEGLTPEALDRDLDVLALARGGVIT